MSNEEYSKQLIRSSGSVCANFIEADEALGKKDRIKHMRISRKESKESIHWLILIETHNDIVLDKERNRLISEAQEFILILSAIINKLTSHL